MVEYLHVVLELKKYHLFAEPIFDCNQTKDLNETNSKIYRLLCGL